ncbi:DMT family transporter [Enterococcus sp. 669A]|uniref:DMT family transporter n=1 Tax=Candidatus Enterococcus moelleringii TaxID=2815325 RepID=A0ABS3LCT5_9ENTE|nr:DMT family transporter [Enterococcus sp. 669A]MBO1306843.1 DMT family transporter [Enterococcus sp. 669A]
MKQKIRNNESKDILLELIAIAFLATGGIFVKLSNLGPINTGFYRVLFSIPLLYPLVRTQLKTISRRDILIILAAGVFLAGDIALWNLSFSYTSVANANLLTNLTPFTVVPLSYFLFKEKVPKLFLLGAGITILGVFILICGKVTPTAGNYLGDLLAFCASFFYGCFLIISYHLRDRISSSMIMFVSAFGSAAALFVMAGLAEGVQVPHRVTELYPLLGLTICLQLIGHNLLAHCQGKINVNLSSIICLSQPVIASVYSFVLFSEKISVMEMLGIAIVIGGIFLVKAQYTKKSGCLEDEVDEEFI